MWFFSFHFFTACDIQVAKLALDLKKKFEYSSPTHSSSSRPPPAASSSSNTKPATPTTSSAPAGQRKPVTFSDMKAELFGGAGNSGSRKKRVAEEKEGEEERDLSAVLSGEDREEWGGEIGGGEIGEEREEREEGGGEIEGGEEREEGEGGEDEDEEEGDVYGGLLT